MIAEAGGDPGGALARQVCDVLLGAGHRQVCYDDALCVREAGFTVSAALSAGGAVWVSYWLPTVGEAETESLGRIRRQLISDTVGHYMHTLRAAGVFDVAREPGAGGHPYVNVRRAGADAYDALTSRAR